MSDVILKWVVSHSSIFRPKFHCTFFLKILLLTFTPTFFHICIFNSFFVVVVQPHFYICNCLLDIWYLNLNVSRKESIGFYVKLLFSRSIQGKSFQVIQASTQGDTTTHSLAIEPKVILQSVLFLILPLLYSLYPIT